MSAVIIDKPVVMAVVSDPLASGLVESLTRPGGDMTGLSMMLFRENLLGFPIYELGLYCLIVAAILTLWSMIVYLRSAWPELKGSIDI